MLIELHTWLTATTAPAARKAGLAAEVAGIAGRYHRHKHAWQPHLNKSAAFIEKNLSQADPNKPILILGAGLGLDLPWLALNAHPAGTILVDAVIPLQTRLRCRAYRNIKFLCKDITGFLSVFWNSKEGQSVTPLETAPIPQIDCGMVISCNLLSQLPLTFVNSPPSDETEQRITGAIQLAHMRALNGTKCPLILITDFERLETTGTATDTTPTVAPHLLPGDPQEEWQWHIAPTGEVRPGLDVTLKIGAWFLSSC